MNDEFIDTRISEEDYELSREGCTCSKGIHIGNEIDCDCPVHCK